MILGERDILIRVFTTLANRFKDIRKSNSFDQLHCVVLQSVIFADPIDRDNVGVVQSSRRLRLPLEPLPMLLFGRCGFVNHLQRYAPLQRSLDRFVDNPHPTVSDTPYDLKIIEGPRCRFALGTMRIVTIRIITVRIITVRIELLRTTPLRER